MGEAMEAAMARLLQAQAQQVQSMAALQGTFDRLAENLTPRAPHASPTALLTKQTPGDDVEAFLEVFERTAEREGWPEDRWAHILAPFLTGDAQRAYQDLGTREATDYPTLKGAILAHYGHNLAGRAQRVHDWVYDPQGPVRSQVVRLGRLTRSWLVTGEGPAAIDRVVMDRCIRALPLDAKRWAAQNHPASVDELINLLENHRVSQQMTAGTCPAPRGLEGRAPIRPSATLLRPAPRTAPRPTPDRSEWRCFSCGQLGHIARQCPAGDVPMPSASTEEQHRPGRCLMTTCWTPPIPGAATVPVRVGNQDTSALIDSGSVVTLIRPEWAEGEEGPRIEVTCVHGDLKAYPTRWIQVCTPRGSFSIRAGLVPDLPVPMIIGRDCPIFERFWGLRPRGGHDRASQPRPIRRGRPRAACAAHAPSGSSDEGPPEEARPLPPSPSTAPGGSNRAGGRTPDTDTATEGSQIPRGGEGGSLTEFSEFPLVADGMGNRKGQFATAQKEDDTLKHAWARVLAHDGQPIDPVSALSYPFFVTKNSLLYRMCQKGGQTVEQLVVPRPYTSKVLYLAHSHLMGAHLGMDKTRERIETRFYWPGMKRAVVDYCAGCPECQLVAPRPSVRHPLIPLPIIEEPFERLAMDIVGPLPKTSRGHRYILVIIDYATRYPEALPLRAATAKAVGKELFLLFSRVGIAKEILTDQGTCFMSRVLKEMLRLLQVKQLRTSVYHPQTDGLVERFNQTLKRMLKKVMEADGKNWDQLLPYVLFGVREVPQASTGFSPFELLYGRRPRGLLDIAKEAWESQPSPHRTIIEHVDQMRTRMAQVWPVVREHLQQAQQAQARVYNRGAQVRAFQPGERVLVLVPSADCKFLAKWQGPYEVVTRVNEANYQVRQPGRRRPLQLYHVNLLKKWQSLPGPPAQPTPALTARIPLPNVPMGDHLSPSQLQDLREVVWQHLDVFSDLPGRTAVATHDIRTEPGVTVRVKPYRVPEARREAIRQEVSRMLQLGVIEESHSAWSSPVVLVPKPDGSYRFCNDFRRLNDASQFDAYPMPRVDELIDRLGTARFISTLDLTKGYWQVPLTTRAREKTAFATPEGLYQYTVLPFGVHGAPATFQRLMDKILRPHQGYAAAYIDDIVIHSDDWETHLSRLRAVLGALRGAGLTANPKKCRLGLEEASYLGYRIGRGNVRPQDAKVEAILSWPRPKTKRQVKSFLGLVGYYQRFIPRYATMAAPLHDLTRKRGPDKVKWNTEANGAFECLRQALCTKPVLVTPAFSLPFLVHTDASEVGLGAVLSQVRDGEEHPVMYISRKFLPNERAYSTVEKEALAIKWALDKLRYYLLGRSFTLVTDHAPLKWMAQAKDSNARVTRWFLTLQDYKFTVEHRPGKEHANADALSRRDVCMWAGRRGPGFLLGWGSCGNPRVQVPRSTNQHQGQVTKRGYAPPPPRETTSGTAAAHEADEVRRSSAGPSSGTEGPKPSKEEELTLAFFSFCLDV
ncbi:uncharacterized protein LOC144410313 isoform X1 [Gasterosteus aculeatus]